MNKKKLMVDRVQEGSVVQDVLVKDNAIIKNPLLTKLESVDVVAIANDRDNSPQAIKTEQENQTNSLPEIVAGRYKLERILGVGGMAVVFYAYDELAAHFKHSFPYVALKIFKEEFASYADASYLLYSEYALLASLNHPHIIRPYQFDIDAETQRAFMTLEFLKGVTLDQWLMENPLGVNFKTIKPMLLDIVEALNYSHQHNVIHGDLKPSNIMLTNEGCILFDYGLGQSLASKFATLPTLSRKRFDAWTPKYVAPELLEDSTVTVKTDIFALSCIIYALLTGNPPYYMDKKTNYAIKPTKPRDLPQHIWQALSCGLAVNPELRTITLAEFSRLLSAHHSSLFFWR